MIRRESAAQLRTMVDDLPDQRAKILKMSKLDELSNREIAERLGSPYAQWRSIWNSP